MTHPRRPKLEKVTIHLTQRSTSFLREWSVSLGISVGELLRRILWDVEGTYNRLEEDQDQGARR